MQDADITAPSWMKREYFFHPIEPNLKYWAMFHHGPFGVVYYTMHEHTLMILA